MTQFHSDQDRQRAFDEERRLAFELAYARYAKEQAGLDDTVEQLAAHVKTLRDGPKSYGSTGGTFMADLWAGYRLAPDPRPPAPRAYVQTLDREQLKTLMQAAQQRLEDMSREEQIEIWRVVVDGVYRYTARSPEKAMAWLGNMAAAYLAKPPPKDEGPLERSERYPLKIENSMVYPDELEKMLAANCNESPSGVSNW